MQTDGARRDRFDLVESPALSVATDLWELSTVGPTPDSWTVWESEIETLNTKLIEILTGAGWSTDQIEQALLDLVTYGMPEYWNC